MGRLQMQITKTSKCQTEKDRPVKKEKNHVLIDVFLTQNSLAPDWLKDCGALRRSRRHLWHAFFKMPANRSRARDGPITAIYGVRSVNSETQKKTVRLKNMTCTGTMSITFYLFGAQAQIVSFRFLLVKPFLFILGRHSLDGLRKPLLLVRRITWE